VPDVEAWSAWLADHHGDTPAVWVVLAKKGASGPTTLTYQEALEEALCHGWIDGRAGRRDAEMYRQRFTPRRSRSAWSRRNVEIAERLLAEGRMRPPGTAEVDRARADGRWEAAYAGSAEIEIPPELDRAFAARPEVRSRFDRLSSQNRYAILYRISTAKRADTRARRVVRFVDMLLRGETIYPQKRPIDRSEPGSPGERDRR